MAKPRLCIKLLICDLLRSELCLPYSNRPRYRTRIRSARNFSIHHCALRSDTPRNLILASRLVRALSKNRRRTEVSVPYSGSPGAVGRHNNTPNRVAFGCVCHKHRSPSHARVLLVVRERSAKGDSLARCLNLKGSGCPRHSIRPSDRKAPGISGPQRTAFEITIRFPNPPDFLKKP